MKKEEKIIEIFSDLMRVRKHYLEFLEVGEGLWDHYNFYGSWRKEIENCEESFNELKDKLVKALEL